MDLICNSNNFFKNPKRLPLNELYFEYKTLSRTSKDEVSLEEMLGKCEKNRDVDKWNKHYQMKVEQKPALDKCWLQQEKRFVEFHSFYPQFSDEENEEFLEKNQEFLEILKQIVNCTYHQFWCYIVCEPRVTYILTHFIEHSVSPYAIMYLNEEFLKLYNEIYSYVCSIYERLLKFNVSETEYMSEAVVMGFLRNSELLSVRTIFLFCFLYNHSNPQLVKRLVDFCFCDKYKQTYSKELMEMLVDIVQEFDKLDCLELLSSTNSGPSILRRKPDKFDPTWLEDTSSYILEMAASLHEFLSVCKSADEIAFELELPQRLSHIYQRIYMQLYDMLTNRDEVGYDWSRYEMLINQWLALGRVKFLNLFYGFSCHLLDKILGLRDDRPEREKYLEMYLGLVSAALDDDLFIRDYNKAHPVKLQFQTLIDNVADFDKTQSDYLLKSLNGMVEELEDEDDAAQGQPNGEQSNGLANIKKFEANIHTKESFPEDLYESIYDTLTQYAEVQRSAASVPGTSKPSSSKNLPEPVFVALKQYAQLMKQWQANPNCWKFEADTSWEEFEPVPGPSQQNINKPSEDEIEQRIKAVLEMLPGLKSGFVLRCLEVMDYQPEQVISRVLDNDLPFALLDIPQDLMPETSGPSETQKKAVTAKMIAYVGKKPDYADARDLLDDKREKQDIKNLVLKASYAYDLDDDYDDRIEVYNTFEREDESKIYRHLKQPAPEYNVISDPSSDSDDEESSESKTQPESRKPFCEDPAVLRAQRAAQRGRNYRPPSRDVVGQPKGQGQDNSVQHNRDKKNVHKSSRANHNRKGGAQWKRNKGMIPS